jgi:hypothetical protein
MRSFTGGDTGISICKKAGMIPIQMELGGKDACIVCAVRNPHLNPTSTLTSIPTPKGIDPDPAPGPDPHRT